MTDVAQNDIYKHRVKEWLSDYRNLILIGIIVLAIIIRLYYLSFTSGQTLWWDESEYGATAKYFSMGLDYQLNNQRPFIFPWIISLLFSAGLLEQSIKFLLVVVPSVALVFATYLLGKEMFNKKIGLLASFLTAVSWTFVFWSSRLQPDFLSMLFQVTSIYFMWRYWKENKTRLIVYAGILASLGFNFKVSGMLVPASFFVFILIKDGISFIKSKDYWIFFASFMLIMIPQFIYSYVAFGSATSFLFNSGYASVVLESNPIGWYVFKFFYLLTENILFVLFLFGFVMASRFVIYFDVLIKDKARRLDARLFSVITILIVLLFYVFYVRGAEDRWVFLWIPFMFFMIGDALFYISDLVRKYNKMASTILILALILFSGYYQLNHADQLIKLKKDSYLPVKDAGLWIRQNSNPQDTVLSISIPQTAYYSERKTRSYSWIKNQSDFEMLIEEQHPKFFQISVFEPHPPAIHEWTQYNQDRIRSVYVTFQDEQRTIPLLIVYEVIYDTNN